MENPNFEDPKLEVAWLKTQRRRVQNYLKRQKLHHKGVSPEPGWFLAPYVAIWSVTSKHTSATIGWWAISGDLPTDYLSGLHAKDARQAMSAFASRWLDLSSHLVRGKKHPTMNFTSAKNPIELGQLLESRAKVLRKWAKDGSLW